MGKKDFEEMLNKHEAVIKESDIDWEKKKKDDLSKEFRKIHLKKEEKASLKDDIIRTWRNKCPQHKTRLDNFGKALEYNRQDAIMAAGSI